MEQFNRPNQPNQPEQQIQAPQIDQRKLIINEIEAQKRCMNCSFYLIKFSSFLDDSSKWNTQLLAKWFAFVLALAADFGLETFIFYHHDHLDSKALNMEEMSRRSKRNILLTLITFMTGNRFNNLLGVYSRDNGEIGIKSIRSFIESILVFCGFQPQSLLSFLDGLQDEEFQIGTREASQIELTCFINFFSNLCHDYFNNHPTIDKQNLAKEFNSLRSDPYDFNQIDSFFRKYYKYLLPDLRVHSRSRRFIEHLSYFEKLFNKAVKRRLLIFRPVSNKIIDSSNYCQYALSSYLCYVYGLQASLKTETSDELVYIIQTIECDLAKFSFKNMNIDDFNQLLQNPHIRMPAALKEYLISSGTSLQQPSTSQSPDKQSSNQYSMGQPSSSTHNVAEHFQPNIPQPSTSQHPDQQPLKDVANASQNLQSTSQPEQPGLRDYLTGLNLERNSNQTSNLRENVQTSILSSLEKLDQPSTSYTSDDICTTLYDPYNLSPKVKSTILSALNKSTSRTLQQVPMPFNLPFNLKSNLINTLTNQPDRFADEDVQQQIKEPIQLEADEQLEPYEDFQQSLTFQHAQAEQPSVLLQHIQQYRQLLKEEQQWQQAQLAELGKLQPPAAHVGHQVQSVEPMQLPNPTQYDQAINLIKSMKNPCEQNQQSDQVQSMKPSTSWQDDQPINLTRSSNAWQRSETVSRQIESPQPSTSWQDDDQLSKQAQLLIKQSQNQVQKTEQMQPSTSVQYDQPINLHKSVQQPSTSYQTEEESIQLHIAQSAAFALSLPPMPKVLNIASTQSEDIKEQSNTLANASSAEVKNVASLTNPLDQLFAVLENPEKYIGLLPDNSNDQNNT